jgi:hypothetical protein
MVKGADSDKYSDSLEYRNTYSCNYCGAKTGLFSLQAFVNVGHDKAWQNNNVQKPMERKQP